VLWADDSALHRRFQGQLEALRRSSWQAHLGQQRQHPHQHSPAEGQGGGQGGGRGRGQGADADARDDAFASAAQAADVPAASEPDAPPEQRAASGFDSGHRGGATEPGSPAARAFAPPAASLLTGSLGTAGLFELSDLVAFPYAVLNSASASAASGGARGTRNGDPPIDVLVIPDFFETSDSYAGLLLPLLSRAAGAGARGLRILVVNLPGQAHSAFFAEGHARTSAEPFNNDYCARALAALLRRLRGLGTFGTRGAPLILFGCGNGGNIATLLAADANLRSEMGVRSLVLCNPFAYLDYHLDIVLQNWLHGVRAGQAVGSDLHLFLFSHLLFSEVSREPRSAQLA
jgi:hypothetical protein